ncbi:hypothetical protein AUP42_15425 [Thalassospira lucentensis]|uniref:Uncharacterized protein n=1 Tax=Thalassospira lucentensis TaxID=168935 RepID=A0A154L8R9_9PROT|nr:hypothetical protein AUP42_15425 [Thalassospira lucentensis]
MDPGFAERGSNGSSGGIGLRPVGGGQVGVSMPEVRLLVKMANARGLSGRRGGREPDDGPLATVAGGPSFVPPPGKPAI